MIFNQWKLHKIIGVSGIKICQIYVRPKKLFELGREKTQNVKANNTIDSPKAKGQREAMADGLAIIKRSTQ